MFGVIHGHLTFAFWAVGALILCSLLTAADRVSGTLIHEERLATATLGAELIQTVEWVNRTTNQFKIRDVEASDDCVQVLSFNEVTRPGEVLQLRLRIVPNTVGDAVFTLKINEDKGWKSLLVRYSITVEQANYPKASPESVARLLIEASAVTSSSWNSNRWIIVDVRTPERFALGHIPDALNLRLLEMRYRRHLREMPILVVGDGYNTTELLKEVSALGDVGSNRIQVLNLGLRGWKMAGGELVGLGPQSSRLFTLNPAEALPFLGRSNTVWFSLSDHDGEQTTSGTRIPLIKKITLPELYESVAELASSPNPTRPIFLCYRNSRDHSTIEQSLSKLRGGHVFFVEGGEVGMSREIAAGSRLSRSQQSRLVSGNPPNVFRSESARRGAGCCGSTK